jgi:hypothetical protein
MTAPSIPCRAIDFLPSSFVLRLRSQHEANEKRSVSNCANKNKHVYCFHGKHPEAGSENGANGNSDIEGKLRGSSERVRAASEFQCRLPVSSATQRLIVGLERSGLLRRIATVNASLRERMKY